MCRSHKESIQLAGEKMDKKENRYFPIFVNLKGRKIVFIGGGHISERRINTLLDFGADILVYSLEITEDIKKLSDTKQLIYEKKEYEKGLIQDAYFVVAATDNEDVNREIYQECKEKNIMVNVISDKKLCDFYFPGIVNVDDITVGVCGSGNDHKKLKNFINRLRDKLKEN